jgi:mycothiol synthase
MTEKLTMKPYQDFNDYWQMRRFLREVMLRNNLRELSWHVARLDYWWWFVNADLVKLDLKEKVFIWRTESGEMAAFLNPEGKGEAFLQVHPDHLDSALMEEMVQTAEENLMLTNENRNRKLSFFFDSHNTLLQEILTIRGYELIENPEGHETQHRKRLDGDLPNPRVASGFTIRPMGDGLDLLERCYASGLGFHDDDIKIARENRDDPSWYRNIQKAPLYRRDLDLVAAAADGSIAAFSTFWFDDVTRTAYTEPVATIPAHRRKGLSQALLLTGLHRLKEMGCQVAFVGGYSKAANALYFSVFGPEHDSSEHWRKVETES